MKKSSLKRSQIEPIVQASRDAGKSDQEIYNELTQHYYDKKGLALMITGIATKENSEKYKIYNVILLCAIGITIAFKIFSVILLSLNESNPWLLLLVSLIPLLNVWFFVEVHHFGCGAS